MSKEEDRIAKERIASISNKLKSHDWYVISGIIIIILLLLFLLPHKSPPIKYEYKSYVMNDLTLENDLNKLGAEGWDIASTRRVTTTNAWGGTGDPAYEIIFRRAI